MAVATVLNSHRFGAAVFDPLTQVTPTHAMWAEDPSWSNPGNGNAASSWRNAGTPGQDPANATGTQQPIYRSTVSQLGNKPALEFDGTDDRLTVDCTDVAQTFKVVVVGRLTSNPGTQRNLVGFGPAATTGISRGGSTFFSFSAGSNINSSVTADTAGHVFRANLAGASSQMWIDGSSVASGGAGVNSFTRIKVGCSGSGTTDANFAPCQVAFYGIYSSATSDTDLATLAADLKSYYGL